MQCAKRNYQVNDIGLTNLMRPTRGSLATDLFSEKSRVKTTEPSKKCVSARTEGLK